MRLRSALLTLSENEQEGVGMQTDAGAALRVVAGIVEG